MRSLDALDGNLPGVRLEAAHLPGFQNRTQPVTASALDDLKAGMRRTWLKSSKGESFVAMGIVAIVLFLAIFTPLGFWIRLAGRLVSLTGRWDFGVCFGPQWQPGDWNSLLLPIKARN